MNTIDITPIVNAAIALIGAGVSVFLIPWLKSQTTEAQRKELTAWVKIGVAAAEQLYKGCLLYTSRLTGPVMGKHKTADAPGGARKAWPELYTAGRLFNGEYRKQHHRALQSIPQNPLRKARQPDRHALPHGGHRAHRRPL